MINPHQTRILLWTLLVSVIGAALVILAINDSTALASPLPPSEPVPADLTPAVAAQVEPRIHLPIVLSHYDPSPPAFGIQFYGEQSLWDSRLDYAVDAGSAWIRWPISWATVEPTNTVPANYDWTMLDTTVISATNQGVNLILTIADQPSWAATYAMGPVTDVVELEEFVGAMVERYDGDGIEDAAGSPIVNYYELYNEPDNAELWGAENGGYGYWGHQGAEYAALMQRLYPVIKTASPDARLVLGGLALDRFEEYGGPFDDEFLDDVLAACQGHDCFDVMNFHYYPTFRRRWESYGADIIGKTNYVRDRLTAYGFGDLLIVCTETSWAGEGSTWGSDELQSRYTTKGFVRGLAAGLDIIVWWFIQDGDQTNMPGLLANDLQPKPSYGAYQTMTGMLTGAYYQRALAPVETGSDQLVGYVFKRRGHRLDVVWTEDNTWYDADDDPWLPYTVQAETVLVIDKFGNEQMAWDLDDGHNDGRITVNVGGSPLYLVYNP